MAPGEGAAPGWRAVSPALRAVRVGAGVVAPPKLERWLLLAACWWVVTVAPKGWPE